MRDLQSDVIFRAWKDTGEIIALWPARDAGWKYGRYCQSYLHFGQHGAADYHHVLGITRPAKPEEYADLLSELQNKGYSPSVIHRATCKHHDTRRSDG